MLDGTSLLLGLLAGGAVVALASTVVMKKHTKEIESLRIDKATLESEKAFTLQQLESLKAFKEDYQKQVLEQFDVLSQKTLKAVRDELETRQKETFKDQKEALNTNITQLLKPMVDMIKAGDDKLKEFAEKTLAQTTSLKTQIEIASKQTQDLIAAKNTLVSALKDSKGRGDWGELELMRLLEESGLQKGIHYEFQVVKDNQSRPDIMIKLPNNNILYIDAKTLLLNLEALEEALDEAEEKAARKKHLDSFKKEVMKLHSRDYQQDGSTVDFVILYVPRESMLRVPLEEDPTLIQEAAKNGVILASPLILMAILKTVAQGWHQSQLATYAHDIEHMARELHKRAATFLESFEKIGKKIQELTGTYDDTFRVFTSKRVGLVEQLRKIEEYGCKSTKSLPPRYQLEAELDDIADLIATEDAKQKIS